MPKLKLYPLKDYIKAVEKLAEKNNFRVEIYQGKGSVVGFKIFQKGESIPCDVWVVHHSHSKKKEIWSKEDYKKPDKHLGGKEEFMSILSNL